MDLAARTYSEKRNFIRMKMDSPVQISMADEMLTGTCINLSGGGMLVSLDRTLAPGSLLNVAISSNHGHNPMLKAVTKVSRVSEVGSGFLVGLEIKNLLNA